MKVFNMKGKSTIAVGFMLFALFFGAGNLIFPAQLGQYAGENVGFAALGFLMTGVGLPLLGILAMAKSGSSDLKELASRIHPMYGLIFTTLLYLTIGPFFAAPRTGTVAYEVGIAPFVAAPYDQIGLLFFTILFFGFVLVFSLYPAKLVDNIGKILAPALVVLLGVLLIFAIFNPMGKVEMPMTGYESIADATINGFLEGYNTMDALASLIFGIIVIQAVRSFGVTLTKDVFKHTMRAGFVAIILLGAIYVGIAYLGATSVGTIGLFDNGGPVLNESAGYYFGTFGALLLALVIILACLTTAIGINIAIAEYFHTLFPKVSQKVFVILFSVMTLIVANFGLENIITFSIPVLMFLYPLAIVLIFLTFASSLFKDARVVYVMTTAVTFVISVVDGLKALCESLKIDYFRGLEEIIEVFNKILPLYESGLGWLLPAVIVASVTGICTVMMTKSDEIKKSNT